MESLNGREKNGAKKIKAGLSRRSLLFFAPFFFSARLDFPYPHYLPLGLQGWVTLGAMFFLTRHAILKPETIQKIEVSHKRNLSSTRDGCLRAKTGSVGTLRNYYGDGTRNV